jgi:hypothetical protein
MMEKRRTQRIQPFIARCHITEGQRRVVGYVTDISLAGAQVACDDAPPEVETPVVLEVRFAPRTAHCRLPARVRWARQDEAGHVCGLTFGDVSPSDRATLEGVIERIRLRADQLS